jgi:hypothetical protein
MAGRFGDRRDQAAGAVTPGAHRRTAGEDGSASAGVPRFLRDSVEPVAVQGASAFTPTALSIQRAPVDGSVAAAAPHVGVEPAGEAADSGAPVPVPGLIVDDAAEPAAGQMRKGEFLALLRGEVCHAAEEALAGTLWSTVGCPYVDRWVEHYRGQDAASVEQALHRHVPEARGAASARDYVPLVAARVRTAVAQWRGQGGEAPEGVAGAEDGAPGGGLISRFVGLFFKGREGEGRADGASPETVRARLGRGQALESGIASRMGSALGRDFSRVRVHTDSRAASLSTGMAARAFTVGEHVAFGAGEYRPGTPVGDALIAHELAHVAQQEGASAASPPGPGSGVLEEEADRSAVGAVARMWGGAAGLAGRIGADALPALRTGLRLQRCSSCEPRAPAPTLFERLREIDDAESLAEELGRVSEGELGDLARASAAGSLLRRGVEWERAVRARAWGTLVPLLRPDAPPFHRHHVHAIVTAIMGGETSIRVDAADGAFASWVEGLFLDLGREPVGFRLIVELLATGQTVDLRPTSGGATTERIGTGDDDMGGRFPLYDENDAPIPFERQAPGRPSGSRIGLNPTIAHNQVTVGGTAAAPEIIEAEETVTFGHELIHALHNARGQNLAPTLSSDILRMVKGYQLVDDPVTGEAVSAEEPFTITGQTRFQHPRGYTGKVDWPLEYNIPVSGIITENMLREERNLPARISHLGGRRAYRVAVPAGESVQQMLARYSMQDGRPIPAPLAAAIRESFLEFNRHFRDHESLSTAFTLEFPHGEYLMIHLRLQGQPDLAEAALNLRVRGAM